MKTLTPNPSPAGAGEGRPVRTKRVYDAASTDDGRRILITRYWPRGVLKSAADEYNTKVAPSRDLVRAFKHEGMAWDEYTQRVLAEIREEPARSEIRRLAEVARREPITLMCMCDNERFCHRSLVARLIVEAMAADGPKEHTHDKPQSHR